MRRGRQVVWQQDRGRHGATNQRHPLEGPTLLGRYRLPQARGQSGSAFPVAHSMVSRMRVSSGTQKSRPTPRQVPGSSFASSAAETTQSNPGSGSEHDRDGLRGLTCSRPWCTGRASLERVMGIEPTLAAWEAAFLRLNYTRWPPATFTARQTDSPHARPTSAPAFLKHSFCRPNSSRPLPSRSYFG